MKVAVVLETFPKLSERFIARELAALCERGIDLRVFALRRGRAAAFDEEPFSALKGRAEVLPRGVFPAEVLAGFRRLARHPLRVLSAISAFDGELFAHPWRVLALKLRIGRAHLLARRIERAGCGLIWAHWASLPGALGMTAARLSNLPFALSCHAWDVFAGRALVRPQLRRARLVTACSTAAIEHLRGLCGPAAGKVRLVHHGIALPEGPPPPRPPRGGRPFRVLGVGRLVPKKGFGFLISAAARGGFEVELVGDGPRRKRLERLAAECGLADRVKFGGTAGAEGLRKAFARADAICAPSVVAPDGDRDGVPNVLLEASAAGLPVLASETGGIPDFVEHGRSGLLVPAGDVGALAGALARLAGDAELGARLVAGAYDVIREKFDIEKNAGKLAGLLRSAAESGS